MKIDILFFGATADAAGTRKHEIEIDGETSLSDIRDQVLENHPTLKTHKLLFSINQEYAGPDDGISDGDEIAIFTPVSGG